MENSKVQRVFLFIAGAIITIPGILATVNPEAFAARNGINLAGNLSLLNDYRGTGGLMLGSGLLILSGAFLIRMRFTSTVVAIGIYLPFALARALSILIDGTPAENLVRATMVEAVLGILALLAFLKYKEAN